MKGCATNVFLLSLHPSITQPHFKSLIRFSTTNFIDDPIFSSMNGRLMAYTQKHTSKLGAAVLFVYTFATWREDFGWGDLLSRYPSRALQGLRLNGIGVYKVSYGYFSQFQNLLRHPLCVALVRHKWLKYGRYLYYSGLLFYCIFLAFLTSYALLTPNAQNIEHLNTTRHKFCEETSTQGFSAQNEIESKGFALYVTQYGILIFAIWNCFLELVQLYRVRTNPLQGRPLVRERSILLIDSQLMEGVNFFFTQMKDTFKSFKMTPTLLWYCEQHWC